MTSIFTAGTTLVVEYHMTTCPPNSFLLTGVRRDVYTVSGQNKIEVMFHSTMFVASDGDDTSLAIVSSGIVVKDL